MKMETLLEKAKKLPVRTKVNYSTTTLEDLDLVLGWLNNEITSTQMCKVRKLNQATGNYLYYCASVIKKFYQEGKLKIKKSGANN